jgi:hypothetical protein
LGPKVVTDIREYRLVASGARKTDKGTRIHIVSHNGFAPCKDAIGYQNAVDGGVNPPSNHARKTRDDEAGIAFDGRAIADFH